MLEEPFDQRLDEAILAEPDELAPRRVLADFLEERGHPRAELLRLALARPPSPPPDGMGMSRAERALLDRYPDELLGTAKFPCAWWVGFVDCVDLHRGVLDLAELWPVIATHRSYRFVRRLCVIRDGFRFDPAAPPAASIRDLATSAGSELLESLGLVRLPRVTRLTIDRRLVDRPTAPEVFGPILEHTLPAVTHLTLECFDEPGLLGFVPIVAPHLHRLRRLELDILTEGAARALLDIGLSGVALVTRNETLSTSTRKELSRFTWIHQLDTRTPDGVATTEPTRAPVGFASLAPVTLVEDEMYSREWVGSGVLFHEHPMPCGGGVCRGCGGTNTVVIWGRAEHLFTHAGWSEHDQWSYELQCRECGRFSIY